VPDCTQKPGTKEDLAALVSFGSVANADCYCDHLLANASYLKRQAAALGAPGAHAGTPLEQGNESGNHSRLRSPIQRNWEVEIALSGGRSDRPEHWPLKRTLVTTLGYGRTLVRTVAKASARP
jgi:hypothetical protein